MPVLTLNDDELRTLSTVLKVAMEKAKDVYTMKSIVNITHHLAESIKDLSEEQKQLPYTDFELTQMDLLHITLLYSNIMDTAPIPEYHWNLMNDTITKIKDIAREILSSPLN